MHTLYLLESMIVFANFAIRDR